MKKITEKGYILPIIEALSPHESFESGANRPLLITGADKKGAKSDYVVKFRGAERMSNEACMRELLATFIAAQMGIKAVSPVVVHVSEMFVELLKDTNTWQYANKSLGFNFGSEYIKRFSTIIPAQDLNNHQLEFAQTIFAFDIFIQNPDRTIEKPNMMTDGTEIVIYDHELAFSFIHNIFPSPSPWEIQPVDLEWIRKHCLLPKIKGKEFDYKELSQRFNNLDEHFWDTARALTPDEWLSDQFDRIKQHITAICNNRKAFITELKKLLS